MVIWLYCFFKILITKNDNVVYHFEISILFFNCFFYFFLIFWLTFISIFNFILCLLNNNLDFLPSSFTNPLNDWLLCTLSGIFFRLLCTFLKEENCWITSNIEFWTNIYVNSTINLCKVSYFRNHLPEDSPFFKIPAASSKIGAKFLQWPHHGA